MGRHAEGWKLEWRGAAGRAIGYVRFTHAKKQHLVSTGKRDPEGATAEAARIYARIIGGTAAKNARPRALVTRSLTELFAEWLASLEGTLDEETAATYRVTYAGKHWPAHYASLEGMCDEAERERYRTARLRKVSAETVKKETWAQDKFLRWCKTEAKVIAYAPPPLEWDKRTLGTRTGRQRQHARELRPEQVFDVLAALPEWHEVGDRALERKAYPVRDRFVFAYETGLRPGTVKRLVWGDWLGNELRIRPEVDKIRFGRVVPLTEVARLALARVFDTSKAHGRSVDPKAPIFGAHAVTRILNVAGRAAGLDGCAPYDLRHGRATHMADAGAALTGIGFVVGHKQATTTNRYLHGGKAAALAALSRSIQGGPVEALAKSGWPTRFELAASGATFQKQYSSIAMLPKQGTAGDSGKQAETAPIQVSDLELERDSEIAKRTRMGVDLAIAGREAESDANLAEMARLLAEETDR